jgi:hypothetical protein
MSLFMTIPMTPSAAMSGLGGQRYRQFCLIQFQDILFLSVRSLLTSGQCLKINIFLIAPPLFFLSCSNFGMVMNRCTVEYSNWGTVGVKANSKVLLWQ